MLLHILSRGLRLRFFIQGAADSGDNSMQVHHWAYNWLLRHCCPIIVLCIVMIKNSDYSHFHRHGSHSSLSSHTKTGRWGGWLGLLKPCFHFMVQLGSQRLNSLLVPDTFPDFPLQSLLQYTSVGFLADRETAASRWESELIYSTCNLNVI